MQRDWNERYLELLAAAGIHGPDDPVPYPMVCRLVLALACWCPIRHWTTAVGYIITGTPPRLPKTSAESPAAGQSDRRQP